MELAVSSPLTVLTGFVRTSVLSSCTYFSIARASLSYEYANLPSG